MRSGVIAFSIIFFLHKQFLLILHFYNEIEFYCRKMVFMIILNVILFACALPYYCWNLHSHYSVQILFFEVKKNCINLTNFCNKNNVIEKNSIFFLYYSDLFDIRAVDVELIFALDHIRCHTAHPEVLLCTKNRFVSRASILQQWTLHCMKWAAA